MSAHVEPGASKPSTLTKQQASRQRAAAIIEQYLNDYGPDDFVMGIDEAGRGPVLGPMVYGCAFCRLGDHSKVSGQLGAKDSKQLSESERDTIAQKIIESDFCEYLVTSLLPKHISGWMLKRSGSYNLNTMSHDTAIFLIENVLKLTGGPPPIQTTAIVGSEGALPTPTGWEITPSPVAAAGAKGFSEWKKPLGKGKLRAVFVDTVGPPDAYKRLLSHRFPWLHIFVEPKADDTWPVVSAASVMAKTTRDEAVKNWQFDEIGGLPHLSRQFGTGYPGEPLTKEWLRKSFTKVFGFPNFVRMSWGTSKEILTNSAVSVQFENEKVEDSNQLTLMQSCKKRRCQYFEEVHLQSVEKL